MSIAELLKMENPVEYDFSNDGAADEYVNKKGIEKYMIYKIQPLSINKKYFRLQKDLKLKISIISRILIQKMLFCRKYIKSCGRMKNALNIA